jgi:hypothetical protein
MAVDETKMVERNTATRTMGAPYFPPPAPVKRDFARNRLSAREPAHVGDGVVPHRSMGAAGAPSHNLRSDRSIDRPAHEAARARASPMIVGFEGIDDHRHGDANQPLAPPGPPPPGTLASSPALGRRACLRHARIQPPQPPRRGFNARSPATPGRAAAPGVRRALGRCSWRGGGGR